MEPIPKERSTHPARTKWTPTLDEPQTVRAWELIHQIADAIRDPRAHIPAEDPTRSHYSLASGAAGIVLFHSYLHLAEPGEGHDRCAESILSEAVDALETISMGPGLYAGFSGIAWTVAHLAGRILPPADADAFESIDAALEDHLTTKSSWSSDYDLVEGLVGFGVYALERLPDPRALRVLEKTIEHLERIARTTPEGITWWTAPTLLHPSQRKFAPDGYYNLGLAHGVPGAIVLLSWAAAAGVLRERCLGILSEAVRWLLSKRLPLGSASCFAPWEAVGGSSVQPARMAWCYGDPGVATALVSAARNLESAGEPTPSWIHEVLEIARDSAVRSLEDSMVADTPLCHGSVGLVHLYSRLFNTTGDPTFADAAKRWFDHTLENRHPDIGIAGFASSEPDGWKSRPGFLGGAAGAGLALLSAATPIPPDWDRVLLTWIPPSRHEWE